jgi:hypothetical protein
VRDDDCAAPDDGRLRTNAWCGVAGASGSRGAEFDSWGLKTIERVTTQLLAAKTVDYANWQAPLVGWGIVLPDNDTPPTDKARASDAPECIRELITQRSKLYAAWGGVPVFRYRSDISVGLLRRYAADGTASDPGFNGKRGVGPDAVPWYLLIVGTPEQIPWQFQYRVQQDAYVGRLDLDPSGLDRYVGSLLVDWAASPVVHAKPVIWSVDFGMPDISRLMRRTIADRLAAAFVNDEDHEFEMADGVLSDASATHTGLAEALTERHPAFIATSSHGATLPLDDTKAMEAQLGLLVDVARTVMDAKALPSAPGAIWYAHACCSAGCDATSSFSGMVAADSTLGQTLTALGKVGARSSLLARHLLGGPLPARAFVGHVEPTFDWTLRDKRTGQVTTTNIVEAMYGRLHLASRPPIGFALEAYHRGVGGFWRDYAKARDDQDEHVPGAAEMVKLTKLVASDREAMVLLGDPTVRCG